MLDTRLVIVEGVMGSGKSTLARFLARQMRKQGIRTKAVMEEIPHPTNVLRLLRHWQEPWLDLSTGVLISLSEHNWRNFVWQARQSHTVYVFDGQFFHGDLTSLMLMNTPHSQLLEYIDRLDEITSPLQPVMVYLYQENVPQALERIGRQRGARWVNRQVKWKVNSPYCRMRGY